VTTTRTTHSVPAECPKCGSTSVMYVQIHRMKIMHRDVHVVDHSEVEPSTGDSFETRLLHVGAPEEEVIDSMGNDETMECERCGSTWPVPKVDDICVEGRE